MDFARAGNGPTLIECKTYRWKGHHCGDPATAYRTREEEEFLERKMSVELFPQIFWCQKAIYNDAETRQD